MADIDLIDRIVAQWAEERPDLDATGFQIAGRLQRLGKLLGQRVNEVLAPLELSPSGFDVLATVRRHGPPYSMTPTELTRATMLTSGAMTNRLDRLEAQGLLQREANPNDRRGVRVVLTKRGRELVDRAIEARFTDADGIVGEMSLRDQRALEKLLRSLLLQLDHGDSAHF